MIILMMTMEQGPLSILISDIEIMKFISPQITISARHSEINTVMHNRQVLQSGEMSNRLCILGQDGFAS